MNETETLYRKVMSREGFAFEPVDIDSLQRYDGIIAGSGIKSDKGVFIRYDDIKKLLQDTLELNQ